MFKEPEDLGLHNEDVQKIFVMYFLIFFPRKIRCVLWIVMILYFKGRDSDFVQPCLYSQIYTLHGTIIFKIECKFHT